jgi:O-antigen chain-terminating methyltransferase
LQIKISLVRLAVQHILQDSEQPILWQRGAMSQTLSTEEILHRMRARVEANSPQGGAGGATTYPPQASSMMGGFVNSEAGRDFFPLRFEIDTAIEGTRQVGQLNPRRPGLHNDAIQFGKKVMRRSLAWYTRPIHYFQGAMIRALEQILVLLQGQDSTLRSVREEVTRLSATVARHSDTMATHGDVLGLHKQLMAGYKEDLAQYDGMLEGVRSQLVDQAEERFLQLEAKLKRLVEHGESLQRELDVQRDRVNGYDNTLASALEPCSLRFGEISDELGWLRSQLDRALNDLRETKLDSRLRDRNWRRFFHDIQAGTLRSVPQTAAAVKKAEAMAKSRALEFDYFRFEEVYRGDEALIRERQKAYLEYFRDRDNVVDIGCGRGEFLELLRVSGIRARGVELGTDQFLLCKEKGLDIAQQDLFEFLESVPDGSLGGLFSAQVIEHLSAADQLRFVALAYQKTSPESPVIFETINIQSLFALSRNFFLDPTHVRPVHPELLKFAMESAKFRNVELLYSGEFTERRIPALNLTAHSGELEAFNRAVGVLNDLVYGYLDYAAVGRH